MNNEKVNEAFAGCRAALTKAWPNIKPVRNQEAADWPERLAHCLWMIDEASAWPAERLEKKFRWLGFVQGVLWAHGIQSIEEAKKQNMPPGEEFKA